MNVQIAPTAPVRKIMEEPTAPDVTGLNLYSADKSLQDVLRLRLSPDLLAHFEPHFENLGARAASDLDANARLADRHPPVLHHRDRHGRDNQWIEFHPAYRALERAGFGDFGLAAMSHRGGVLGWNEPLPPIVKYAMTYLFAESEFGLLCPINMTDSLTRVLRRFADHAILQRYLPGLISLDPEVALQGAMLMTEKAGGSDVGALETIARQDGDGWRLYGEKWFCSNADADLALVLARPEGATHGTRGLGLFLLPRVLPDGSANSYRLVRLKDKLGTRCMASGEVVLEGAQASLVGDIERGFVQMAEMVNASRLSNAVRSAGLMRRAFNEAREVCRHRVAFGRRLMDFPLQRRQLMKIMLPAEQALSMTMYTATVLEAADRGDKDAAKEARLLTPLLKFRACRDARKVTGDAMEIRGGCGYIEDFVEARLLRDAHLGSIWEGTSNIVASDAIARAVGREAADAVLEQVLRQQLAGAAALPENFRARLEELVSRAFNFARDVAIAKDDAAMRRAASALYNVTSAVLLAGEGARLGEADGAWSRAALAGLVVRHKLLASDPLADWPSQHGASEALINGADVSKAELPGYLA
ncbi:MAG: acyl-CoA dehydrogenase [Methylobacteriaceae bacterium]|jgi:alkylation response protein AidB-like acyl-CoA dehydrogenase|nr:acyl-CoA dehydrogenase [Methylobacteriaceae bacterium]